MSRRLSASVFLLVIAAATLAVYMPSLSNNLVFDDARLTDGTIFGSFGNSFDFRPRMLSYGSFVWVQSIFGDGWWKQRVFNVILHVFTAAGLYALYIQLLQSSGFAAETRSDPDFLPSAAAALQVGVALFALNPVAAYAVAYLIQRSVIMAALFVVLACAAWVRGLVTGRRRWLGLALACYVLAVLCKETAVTAAALSVPLYIFVQRPGWKRIVLVLSVSLVLTLAVAGVLLKSYGSILGVAFDESSRFYVQQLEALSPGMSSRLFPLSILNQAALFFAYGFLWFIPNIEWMSIDLRPSFPLSFDAFPQLLGALGFLALLAAAAWLVLRHSSILGFLGLCLLLPILLYFSEFATVWVQDPFVLYRSYLWAVALPGLVALPLIGLKPKIIYPLGVVLAVLFASLAVERSLSLKDELAVWSDAAEKVDRHAKPNVVGRWRPFINRGAYYLEHDLADYAYIDFVQAVALGEPNGSARFNMGVSQQMVRKHQEALASFAAAEAMGFREPALYYQRAETLQSLGRYNEAYDNYSIALAKPHDPQLGRLMRVRRAEAALVGQRYDRAIEEFDQLLKESPADNRSLIGLGMAYVGKDDSPSALAIFNRLLAMHPTAAGYYGRGLAYVVGAQKERGLKDVDQAIALEPANPLYKAMRTRITAQK
jgi:tetratricopeptide (TPR) repeat protein